MISLELTLAGQQQQQQRKAMRFELRTAPQGEVLRQYVESRARVTMIMGPLGSGKTYASCEKIFKLMCQQRPNINGIRKSRWYAIRNTYPDLLSTTVKDWLDIFGELGRYKGGSLEPPSHTLHFRLGDGTTVKAELVFLALDRPQSIKRLRGAQVTGFWLNEAKELDKSIVDMADLRHGRYPSKMDGGPSWHGMIGDTNAPDDDSWFYKMAEETRPEGWLFLKQPGGLLREYVTDQYGKPQWTGKWLPNLAAENLNNLPENYYIHGKEGKSDDWLAVNMGNEYGSVVDGKPVYKDQWIDNVHYNEKIQAIPDHPIYIGLDFGLTPAAVIGQETPRGALHILDELVSEGMGAKQFTQEILLPHLRAYYPANPVDTYVGDPSGNKRAETDEVTVFKILQDLGIDVIPANTNDEFVRHEAVRNLLQQMRDGKPAFQLGPRCKTLRKGFNGGYHYRRIQLPGELRYTSKVDKNKYSHPHDALQYLAMYVTGSSARSTKGFKRDARYNGWGH